VIKTLRRLAGCWSDTCDSPVIATLNLPIQRIFGSGWTRNARRELSRWRFRTTLTGVRARCFKESLRRVTRSMQSIPSSCAQRTFG
jgi:hypothetical protein